MPDATFSKATREGTHHLNLTEADVAQFARFVREFVTMSLVPWMERCVLDWNESVRQREMNKCQLLTHFLLLSTLPPEDCRRDCSLPLDAYSEVPVAVTIPQRLLYIPLILIKTLPHLRLLVPSPDLRRNNAVSLSSPPSLAT
jgi:hypothetical protein